MAVRKTGMVTYGVGFNNDNGEYFWNDDEYGRRRCPRQVGTVHRRRSCNRRRRLRGYQGKAVTPMRFLILRSPNWGRQSPYTPFAFHRHLLTGRGRSKHTLTGDIGPAPSTPPKLCRGRTSRFTQIRLQRVRKATSWLYGWITHRRISSPGHAPTEWRAMTGSAVVFITQRSPARLL